MKEQIILLRKRGKSINEIVNELGCAKSTVSYHINKAGLGGVISDSINSSFDVNVHDKQLKELIDMRNLGYGYEEIHKKTKYSKDFIKRIFRELGLNKPIFISKASSLNQEEVIEKYREYKSLRKLSKIYSVSRDTLRKIITDDIINEVHPKMSNIERNNVKKKAVMDWRKRTKQKLVDYKGGKCEKCGYDKSIQVLQFHHLNPEEKDFTISGKSYSFERMKKEVDKCMMVCANCHIEIHEEERNRMP